MSVARVACRMSRVEIQPCLTGDTRDHSRAHGMYAGSGRRTMPSGYRFVFQLPLLSW